MLLALLLLAPPAPAPTVAPTPVVVSRSARTLADVARERKLSRDKPSTSGAFSAADNRGMWTMRDSDDEIWTELRAKRSEEERRAYWWGRVSSAETALSQAQAELTRAQGTSVVGGNAISHSVAMASVAATIEAAKTRVQSARQHLDAVTEEARKAGYPPLGAPAR